MCHVSVTFIAYLDYQEPSHEKITNKEKKKWLKQIEDIEILSEEKRLNLGYQWRGTFDTLMSVMRDRISSNNNNSKSSLVNKRAVKLRQKSAIRILLNVYLVEYGGFCKIVLKNIAKAVLTNDSEYSIEKWIDEIQKDIQQTVSCELQ